MPPELFQLRQKLGQKAKQEPKIGSHALWAHCDPVTLKTAWGQVRANEGAPGVDGVSIEVVEKSEGGVEGFLRKISRRNSAARPIGRGRVKRVYIAKVNGKSMPLGIPTVRDRVVQTATLLILEPIFEADFEAVFLRV